MVYQTSSSDFFEPSASQGHRKPEGRQPAAHLIDAIYETFQDDSLWGEFLDKFIQAVSAARGSLVLRNLKNTDFGAVCRRGWPEHDIALYTAKYASTDVWSARARELPTGTVATDEEYCCRAEVEASAAYREFYSPRDCCHGMGGMIISSPELEAAVTVVRGKSAGRFGREEVGVLRELMPHLHRAVSLQSQIDRLQALNSALSDQVNTYQHGFFLLDCGGQVVYQNAMAEKVFQARNGLTLDGGRLRAHAADEQVALKQAMSTCFERGESSRAVVTAGGHQLRLMLFPQAPAKGIRLSLTSVVFVNGNPAVEAGPELLQDLFGMTKAEARVAMKLAEGLDIREIARSAGISVETVRTHLRRTMAKTGTNRQGALVALVLKSLSKT